MTDHAPRTKPERPSGTPPDPPFPLPGRFRAVVFDMDGLLLDSEDAWYTAERELLARHGAEFTEADRLETVGRSIDASVEAYARRIGWGAERVPDLRRQLMDLIRVGYGRIGTMPGARELVDRLRGRVPIGLASNTDRALVEHALVAAGLESAFDAIVTAEEVAHPKPAPDVYRRVCELLGVEPSEAVALEDSAAGVNAAKAAGLTCVAVPKIAELDVSAADHIIDSLEAFLEG